MAAIPCCKITRPNRASKLEPYRSADLTGLFGRRAPGTVWFAAPVGVDRAALTWPSPGELRSSVVLFVPDNRCLFPGIKILLTLLTGGEPYATISLSQDHSSRVRRQAGLAAPENFET